MIFAGDWAMSGKAISTSLPQNHYVINLEASLINEAQHKRAPKAGPSIINHFIPHIPKSQITCVLANNHIMDFGASGLTETIRKLDANTIKHCGAGLNLNEANKPLFLKFGDKKVGILNYCESQFGIANIKIAGVNPLSPASYTSISHVKTQCDYLVISVHAGLETMPLPSPYLRELYKSFIDIGADLIHGHHSHIPQGFETYKGKQIYYGLGNFAVPFTKWSSLPNGLWSYGIKLIEQNGEIKNEIEVFEITETNQLVVSSSESLLSKINHLNAINDVLTNETRYDSVWHEMAMRCFDEYGQPFLLSPQASSPGIKKQIINRLKGKKEQLQINPKQSLLLKHLFSCESHREMMITALSILGGETEDLRTEQSKSILDALLKQA